MSMPMRYARLASDESKRILPHEESDLLGERGIRSSLGSNRWLQSWNFSCPVCLRVILDLAARAYQIDIIVGYTNAPYESRYGLGAMTNMRSFNRTPIDGDRGTECCMHACTHRFLRIVHGLLDGSYLQVLTYGDRGSAKRVRKNDQYEHHWLWRDLAFCQLR